MSITQFTHSGLLQLYPYSRLYTISSFPLPLLLLFLPSPPPHLLFYVPALSHNLSGFLFFWDTRSTMEKICQFLGKKLEPEELDSVLRNSSFQAMKENSMSNSSLLKGRYLEENGELLRKGKRKCSAFKMGLNM